MVKTIESKSHSTKNGTLAAQKKTVKRIALDFLGAALLLFAMSVIVLTVALTLDDKTHANSILYGALPIVFVLFAVFLFFSVKRFVLFRSFDKIRSKGEEVVTVDCEKLRFITHAVSRSYAVLIGVVFIAANRKKYVYILPDAKSNDNNTRADMRSKCLGKTLEITCYKGSRLVKYFDFGLCD